MKHLLIAILAITFALPSITALASLTKTEVSQLYIGVFGRASEGGGNSYWQTDPQSTSMTATANVMLNTDPAKAYFGSTLDNNQDFIEHIYLNTLGKTYVEDADGVDYWVSELEYGKTKGEVIAALIVAAQDPTNAGAAQDRFNNKVEVSDYCADEINEYTNLETFTGFLSSVTDDPLSVNFSKELIAVYLPDIPVPASPIPLYGSLSLIKTYEIPFLFGDTQGAVGHRNVVLNGDNLFLAGGQIGASAASTKDGSIVFSTKVFLYNMLTGTEKSLEINATTGDPSDGGTVASGVGSTADVKVIGSDKYLISGGFQYVNTIEFVDFSTNSVKTTLTDIPNARSFYTDFSGSVLLANKDVLFFGENFWYGSDRIGRWSYADKSFSLEPATLEIPRMLVRAEKLLDGRILLVGGYNGHASYLSLNQKIVEIYNPTTKSITRVADYPVRTLDSGNRTLAPVNNDSICVGGYQYFISSDSWESGCNIDGSDEQIVIVNNTPYMKLVTPMNFIDPTYGFVEWNGVARMEPAGGGELKDFTILLGQLSNGNLVSLQIGMYSPFDWDESILGYPMYRPTLIHVWAVSE
jgi:hypothetical protein